MGGIGVGGISVGGIGVKHYTLLLSQMLTSAIRCYLLLPTKDKHTRLYEDNVFRYRLVLL